MILYANETTSACVSIVLKLFSAAWRHSWLKPLPSRASCPLLWIFTESHRLICSATVVFLLPFPSDGSMISDYEWKPIWPFSRPTQWRQTQGCYSSFLSISSVSDLRSNVCVCAWLLWFQDLKFCNIGVAFKDTDRILKYCPHARVHSLVTSWCIQEMHKVKATPVQYNAVSSALKRQPEPWPW